MVEVSCICSPLLKSVVLRVIIEELDTILEYSNTEPLTGLRFCLDVSFEDNWLIHYRHEKRQNNVSFHYGLNALVAVALGSGL